MGALDDEEKATLHELAQVAHIKLANREQASHGP